MNGVPAWGRRGLSPFSVLLKIGVLLVSLIGLGTWGGSASAAPPAWQASSAIAASTGADVTVTLPAHAANDILLLQVLVRDVNDTITWPAGWAQLATVDRGTTARYWWAWKRAASSAETNPLVNKSSGTGDTYAAVTTYRGAITTGDPWEVVGTPNTSTAAGHVLNGITSLTAESLIVASLCGENNTAGSGTTFSATDPASLAQVLYVESATGGDGACTAGAGARTAAGATGNVTATWTAALGGSGGIVLALKPVAVTINRADPDPTTAASVSWTVTFNTSVTGVSSSNFALVNSGLGGAPAITSVSGSGTTWTVTASTGTGTGTLGLDMVNATGISPAISGTPFTGEVYSVRPPVSYYHDTTNGVNIGFDGPTNVTSGTNQAIPPIITASLITANTCTGSARSANHPTGLYTHSRWYLTSDYAVDTSIGANPSGRAYLRGGAATDTVIVRLYDYDPVSGAKVLIGSSATITLTGGGTTTAYPYTISSSLYTVPAGRRLMLEYNFNQPVATYNARVYCSAANAYITVTESPVPLVVSASASTVTANPTSVAADNVSTSLITVTLKTSTGTPVPGKTVTLAAGSGSSTITTVSGTTDASGVATFTAKDGTVEGPITYTATDSTDAIVITQTAQVTFTTPPLCFTDAFGGALGASWSVGNVSGSWTPAIVSGRLRMTDTGLSQATWATLQQPFPAAGNKATVEFDHFAYGGTGADGIAVVFSDASVTPVAGAFGGSLGYAQKSNPGSDCTIPGGCPGFAGGWLGIALDEYGNYSTNLEGRLGGGATRVADSVAIRGSGSGMAGYRFLQGTATLSPGVDGNNVPPGTVAHRYRIIIDHTDSVHAYVSVERDTTSGAGTAYTTLIAPFDVKDPGYSQSAIPTNFNLSITGSSGSLTNIHEIGNLSVCTGLALVPPALHHVQIEHEGNACTTGTTPVTVKACANAGCSSLYLGSVTVDLSPNAGGGLTWTPSEPVTFSGGSVVLDLANTAAGTITLGGTASSPTAGNATQCFNGATETCSLTFSACTVDAVEVSAASAAGDMIYTKLANTAFNLHVVRTGGGNQSVTAVELVDASSGTCSTHAPLPATVPASTIAPTTFTLSGGTPRQTVAFTYNDAAPNVRVRLTTTGPVLSCSSDNFAIRPQLFTVTSSASNSGNSGTPMLRAGTDTFTLTATAVYGATPTTTSGYTGVPRLNSSLIYTNLANLGAVTTATFPTAVSGVSTASGLKYDEVGNFNLNPYAVYDDAFADVDSVKGECTAGFSNTLDGNGKYSCQFGSDAAGPFGRFVPDHFALSLGSIVTRSTASCSPASSFTYMDEPMQLVFTLTAQNAGNGTTRNYYGAYASLDPTNLALWPDSQLGLSPSMALGAIDTAAPTPLTARMSVTAITATGWAVSGSEGSNTVTATAKLVRGGAPDGVFNSVKLGIDPRDSDGVRLPAYDLDANNDTTNERVQIGGTTSFRYGRLRLVNAYGSELLDVRVPLRAEFYNGGVWSLNSADSCSAIPTSAFFSSGALAPVIQSASPISLSGGLGTLIFNKTSAVGSFNLAANLNAAGSDTSCNSAHGGTAANLPWLQGFWAPAANCNSTAAWVQDPNARIRLGASRAPHIYLRERY